MDILENLGKGRVRENFLLDQSRYNDGITSDWIYSDPVY